MKKIQYCFTGLLILAVSFVPFGYAMDSSTDAMQKKCDYKRLTEIFVEYAALGELFGTVVSFDKQVDSSMCKEMAIAQLREKCKSEGHEFPSWIEARDRLGSALQEYEKIYFRQRAGLSDSHRREVKEFYELLVVMRMYIERKPEFLSEQQQQQHKDIGACKDAISSLARRVDDFFKLLNESSARFDQRIGILETRVTKLTGNSSAPAKQHE